MEKFEKVNRFLYKAAEKFLNDLDDIPYAVIKGVPLSYIAYGNTGTRHTSDIDILIDKKNLNKIESRLRDYGFSQGIEDKKELREKRIFCFAKSHQLLPYEKKFGKISVQIDLNFSLFWGEYTGEKIDISSFIEDRMPIKIYESNIYVLQPEKALIQLCLHHYKEMNSIYLLANHNSIYMEMFRDVFYLLNNTAYIVNSDKLVDLCREYHVEQYIYYVLYYTETLYSNSKIKDIIERLQSESGQYLLDKYGLSANEQKVWKVDFETRLQTENLYTIIEKDLQKQDLQKIEINRRVFG